MASIVWYYIIGAIALLAGILTCIFSDNGDFQHVIILILGILIIIDASLRILGNVLKIFRARAIHSVDEDYASSIVCASELAVGVIVVAIAESIKSNVQYADIIFDYVTLFGGIFFIVVGCTTLIKGIFYLARKYPTKDKNIYRVVGGFILIIAGTLVLAIVYPASDEAVFHLFFMLLGIYLIVFAAGIIIATTITYITHRRLEKLGEDDGSGSAE